MPKPEHIQFVKTMQALAGNLAKQQTPVKGPHRTFEEVMAQSAATPEPETPENA
jgi:hypothetical protein